MEYPLSGFYILGESLPSYIGPYFFMCNDPLLKLLKLYCTSTQKPYRKHHGVLSGSRKPNYLKLLLYCRFCPHNSSVINQSAVLVAPGNGFCINEAYTMSTHTWWSRICIYMHPYGTPTYLCLSLQ